MLQNRARFGDDADGFIALGGLMSRTPTHIGQHLFIGLPAAGLDGAGSRLLATVQPGGVVLFARNIESSAQLRTLTESVRAASPGPVVIAVDQECEAVNRFRSIAGEAAAIAELKADGSLPAAEWFGRTTGAMLRAHGVDVDFAPVLDIARLGDGHDNALRERCWGDSAAEVVRWAGAFIAGLHAEGVAACPKHFPGLGAARVDSHESLPTILCSHDELMREDARAFEVVLPGVMAVMVGHGHYPALDGDRPLPASLSAEVIGGLLRGRLGFDGLVVTDDLEMGAVARQHRVEDAVVAAVAAGADMLLVCHTLERIVAAYEALVRAAETGQILPQRLAESRQRLRKFHQRLAQLRSPGDSEASATRCVS
jgi:beta-N-acetylhexosaminidase